MGIGVDLIGLKERVNLPMLLVLILAPLVRMRLIALAVLMIETVQTLWAVVRKRIGN
jgi:hypothetical protein